MQARKTSFYKKNPTYLPIFGSCMEQHKTNVYYLWPKVNRPISSDIGWLDEQAI